VIPTPWLVFLCVLALLLVLVSWRISLRDFGELAVDGRSRLTCVSFERSSPCSLSRVRVRCFQRVAEHPTDDDAFVSEVFMPDPTLLAPTGTALRPVQHPAEAREERPDHGLRSPLHVDAQEPDGDLRSGGRA
jgi:hypothetical protein